MRWYAPRPTTAQERIWHRLMTLARPIHRRERLGLSATDSVSSAGAHVSSKYHRRTGVRTKQQGALQQLNSLFRQAVPRRP